jgi:predicted enzyme related to lactoylglutathione lyase
MSGFYFPFVIFEQNLYNMDSTTNALNWFDIPVTDMERAKKFYEKVFAIKLSPPDDMMGMKMSYFPGEMGNGKVSGALVKSKNHKPSKSGTVIYLNANPRMSSVVGRIEKAGGKVLMPKTQISKEIGYMAFFTDTEGNRMALHSNG